MTNYSAERLESEFLERRAAWTAVRAAIQAGNICRPERCTLCGADGKVEAHHPDYSQRLNIIWLCMPCHRAEHLRLRRTVAQLKGAVQADQAPLDNRFALLFDPESYDPEQGREKGGAE